MSRSLALLPTLLLVIGVAACDDGPGLPPEDGPPQLELERASVNLGEIELGEPATASWLLRNTGGGPAQIQRVDLGSGELALISETCTGELAPYADCVLQVAVRPARAGGFAAELAIVTASGDLVARVEAVGRARVTVAVDGAARVTSEPAGIDCGAGGTACMASFTVPGIVLRASGDATLRWSGACAGFGACKLDLTGPLEVGLTELTPLLITAGESPTRFEFAVGLAIDAANRIIVTGEGAGPLTGDVWTGAFDGEGDLAWRDLYDYGAEGHDTGYDVAVTADGTNIVVGQWYSSSNTRWNMFIRALDPNGVVLWSRASEDVRDDAYRGVAIDDASGAIYAVGYRADPDLAEDVPALHTQGVVQRLDGGGALVWERRWQGTTDGDDVVRDVAVAAAGSIVVTGTMAIAGRGADARLAAYAADGTLAWSRLRGGDGDDAANAVAVAPDGTLAVVGHHDGMGWIARYSAAGELLDEIWTPDVASWHGVGVLATGELAVTGGTETRLYAVDLEPLWSERSEVITSDLEIDHEGNVIVCGRLGGDLAIVKYFE